jgi:hypothetical protein
MLLKAYWAYAFSCDKSMKTILTACNEAGPWQWEERESAWYSDYLSTRPVEGVRVRIHEFPQSNEVGGVFVGPGSDEGVHYDKGYTGLLEIREESAATKEDVDKVFRDLMSKINAENIKEIEPYD